jgi:DNA-binding PadR family transcriptional regulator
MMIIAATMYSGRRVGITGSGYAGATRGVSICQGRASEVNYPSDISTRYILLDISIENREWGQVRSRADSLEFALLGLLSESPLHGYELRKRLMAIFGPFRALSFSVLYPQLKRMVIAETIEAKEIGVTSKRTRIVYTITKKGQKRFAELNGSVTAEAWEDEGFGVRFAFFSPTTTMNRVRILEGRLSRLHDKAKTMRAELESHPAGIDKYLEEWRRFSLESLDREITWLEGMIKNEGKK